MSEKMIRLVRFMSEEELNKYLVGEKLENKTKWECTKKSDSEGFCFFPMSGEDPESRMEYMSGVATMQAVLVVDAPKKLVRESYGMYRDPNEELERLFGWPPKMMRRLEYCTTSYNKREFPAVKIGFIKSIATQKEIEWAWKRENRTLKQRPDTGRTEETK